MSTTEPTPTEAPGGTPAPAEPVTPATVVADVHQVLKIGQAAAQQAVSSIEHAGLGHLVEDAKQLVERAFEDLQTRLHDLFHGSTPAPASPGAADASVPTQNPPTA